MAQTRAHGRFAADIYKNCASQSNENVILSPYSIGSALSLACQGAKAETFDVLRNGLHLTGTHDEIANEYCDQMAKLTERTGEASLIVANKMFVQTGYPVRESFRDVAAKKYGTDVEAVDFKQKKETASAINSWVQQKTNNNIKDLVDADSLDGGSSMVLVNAIYFNAKWEHPFPSMFTAHDIFWMSKDVSKKIEFMNNRRMYRYAAFPMYKCSGLALNFKNSAFAFLILLPDEREGLPQLEKHLQGVNMIKLSQKLKSKFAKVKIPKLKNHSSFNLEAALSEMGMGDIFVEGKADFTGIFDSDEPMWVGDVIHMAFIDVHESGIEAGAASYVGLMAGGGGVLAPKPVIFNADRPFLYAVLDADSNAIAFMGKFMGQ